MDPGRACATRRSSRSELAQAVVPLVAKINDRLDAPPGKSRRQLFEELDKPVLRPLPERRYELAEWKKARVNIDYHIEFDEHVYSVPYQLAHERVEVRATASCVEIFHQGRRVASHVRSSVKHKPTTDAQHMPASHRAHLEWTPSRIINWAATIGPCTANVAEQIMKRHEHPEHGIARVSGSFDSRRDTRTSGWSVHASGRCATERFRIAASRRS